MKGGLLWEVASARDSFALRRSNSQCLDNTYDVTTM